MPAGAEHSYRIAESFTAVEATAPPEQVHGRDEVQRGAHDRRIKIWTVRSSSENDGA